MSYNIGPRHNGTWLYKTALLRRLILSVINWNCWLIIRRWISLLLAVFLGTCTEFINSTFKHFVFQRATWRTDSSCPSLNVSCPSNTHNGRKSKCCKIGQFMSKCIYYPNHMPGRKWDKTSVWEWKYCCPHVISFDSGQSGLWRFLKPDIADHAPVPLTVFRSNSKCDQNSSSTYAQPITTKIFIRHDSCTVVTCATFCCDR